MSFNWKKALGYGVLLWAMLFAIIAVFKGLNLYDDYLWIQLIIAVSAGVLGFLMTPLSKGEYTRGALAYGLTWAAICFVLDAAIRSHYHQNLFSSWIIWLQYALILLAPWVQTNTSRQQISAAHPPLEF